MQPITFACPHCTRKMGVGLEMLGRPVRCPHCRQVVIAPKTPPASANPPPAPPVPPLLPQFDTTKQEGAESILSPPGTDDDSVFESTESVHKVELPDAPLLQPTAPILRTPDVMATPKLPNPQPASPPAPTAWQPVPFPNSPQPTTSTVSSPWTKLDDLPDGKTRPVVTLPPLPTATLPSEKLAAAHADAEAAADDRRRRILLIALACYSAVVTALAVWSLLRGGDHGHPLNNVPDLFGEFAKSSREQARRLPLTDDTLTVPAERRVKLNESFAAGVLTVEPLGVEERAFNRVTEFETKPGQKLDAATVAAGRGLVLRLRLTNTSTDQLFHPMDTAFNRLRRDGYPDPLTGLILPDQSRHMGGPVEWPFGIGKRRVYLEGQEGDEKPLWPGQSRETFIASQGRPELVKAVRDARGPVLWQLHLRRGLTRYRWQDVPVTAVLGVEFEPRQVKRLADG